ncbi:MAG: ribose 5-phosphate isomerase B [Anaerolineae bacterium]
MKIIVASDHVGFRLKQAVVDYLASQGLVVTDAGPGTPEVPVDYPDYAQRVGQMVAAGEYERGVLICGTGLGMSIAANKMPGVRAALCHDVYTAQQSRAHNDANILAMGAWVVTPERAAGILDAWLNTEFEGGRHIPRLARLDAGLAHAPQERGVLSEPAGPRTFHFGLALSPQPTSFGPLLFAGQLTEGLRVAAEAGFTAVELSLRSAEDIQEETLATMLSEYDLSLAAVATGQSCIHDSLCLCDPRLEVREATVARLKSAIRLAARFDASVIVGGIRGRLSGTVAEQARQRAAAVEAIRECARFAAGHGVTLLVEPLNRYETNFVNTAAEGLALLDELGEPSVKLLLDTFHMNLEEADLAAALQEAGDRLGYVHVADSNRRAPGQGHLDFSAVLRALVLMAYTGIITAEVLPLPDDLTAARQAGHFLHQLAK